MKRKFFLSILLMAALGVLVFGQSTDGFEYKIDSRGMVISAYTGTDTQLSIPGKINGTPVVAIGYQAFAFKRLTGVSIPDSVKYIDTGAFYGNQLTKLILPTALVSIGDIAFSLNRISSIVIPDSVTTIGADAFSKNRLTSISLPDGVNILPDSFYVSVFEKYAEGKKKKATFSISIIFSGQYEIAILDNSVAEIVGYYGDEEDLVIPGEINGMPVVGIGDKVFSNHRLTNVVIPNSVQIIGDDAFVNNKLVKVIIPNSVKLIGNGAFINNQISAITLPDFLVSIGNAAFTSNNLTEVTLPNSLVSIGFAAFSANKLSDVDIPDSVKSIGEYAFDSNVKVKNTHLFIPAGNLHSTYHSY